MLDSVLDGQHRRSGEYSALPPRLATPQVTAAEILRERGRSARTDRPTTAVLFSCCADSPADLRRLSRSVARQARAADFVGWLDDRSICALLSDTHPAVVDCFTTRVTAGLVTVDSAPEIIARSLTDGPIDSAHLRPLFISGTYSRPGALRRVEGNSAARLRLRREHARTGRTGAPLSVLAVHAPERRAYLRAARAVVRSVRSTDAVGATGERSLMVILPATSPDGADALIARLSRQLEPAVRLSVESHVVADPHFSDRADVRPHHRSAKVGPLASRSRMVDFAATIDAPALEHTAAARVVHKSAPICWPARYDVLGVDVSATTYEQITGIIMAAAHRRQPALATFLPVHGIITAALDPGYRYRINAFDVVGPDGQPVRWALNLLHRVGLTDRVCGPDAMRHVCARAAAEGVGIYLYGSSDDVLGRLVENLKSAHPDLRIVGYESPPFRKLSDAENLAAVERINGSGAGLVFIGLGCPRQDYFAFKNRNRIQAVQLCVGAAFDFHAGNKKRPPAWMQKHGLEWVYRLVQEPGRLWKRYLVTNTAFVVLMTRRVVKGR